MRSGWMAIPYFVVLFIAAFVVSYAPVRVALKQAALIMLSATITRAATAAAALEWGGSGYVANLSASSNSSAAANTTTFAVFDTYAALADAVAPGGYAADAALGWRMVGVSLIAALLALAVSSFPLLTARRSRKGVLRDGRAISRVRAAMQAEAADHVRILAAAAVAATTVRGSCATDGQGNSADASQPLGSSTFASHIPRRTTCPRQCLQLTDASCTLSMELLFALSQSCR